MLLANGIPLQMLSLAEPAFSTPHQMQYQHPAILTHFVPIPTTILIYQFSVYFRILLGSVHMDSLAAPYHVRAPQSCQAHASGLHSAARYSEDLPLL
ncbi:MAG: hypothetical protein NXY57DRAFT_970554 [Lentinula lateritia]|nr:MAG: hypothetical protein NXY57DRAFT_970554 [Lentinula lateritia]